MDPRIKDLANDLLVALESDKECRTFQSIAIWMRDNKITKDDEYSILVTAVYKLNKAGYV